MLPGQTVEATLDLKAKVILPVHRAKFVLANHEWNEPVKRVIARAHDKNLRVTTPLIGEAVVPDSICPASQWWNF